MTVQARRAVAPIAFAASAENASAALRRNRNAVDSLDVRPGQSEVHPADAAPQDRQPPLRSPLRYELKLDGYRTIAFKNGGKLHLRSRNDKDFSGRYPGVLKGLAKGPDEP